MPKLNSSNTTLISLTLNVKLLFSKNVVNSKSTDRFKSVRLKNPRSAIIAGYVTNS